MKSTKLILVVAVLAVFSSSCHNRNGWGLKGKGSTINETRGTEYFDRISLCIDGDVYYTQDSSYLIEVSAQSNILPVLETKVVGAELKISFKREVWQHDKIKVIVHSPNMYGFNISGSGDIRVQNKVLYSSAFLTNISGSGNITIPSMSAQSLEAKISGSGNIEVNGGKVNSENYSISGSGDIRSTDLLSLTNKSRISGSGSISANVTESLDISISGSGDVKYKGKPGVTSSISGSGKIIHLN